MRGLEPPPKADTPSKLAGRFLTLIVFALGAGIAIYTAVTNQRADVSEDLRPVNVETPDPTVIDGFVTNVVDDPGGPQPVVILHDDDITGGLVLADLSGALSEPYHGARLDLPGFGYSTRIPEEGPAHTVAGMADRISAVVEERYGQPVAIIGIGLGGEVGAEMAHSYPEQVTRLVMVDTDFWSRESFEVGLERLPWVGKAATYTWETGGRLAAGNWAPYCGDGGWCPSPEQSSERSVIIEIVDTTDSMYSFRRTNDAALAPGNLEEIVVPVGYVWSTQGEVPQRTIDRLDEEIAGLVVTESDTFQAHLQDPATVVAALAALEG